MVWSLLPLLLLISPEPPRLRAVRTPSPPHVDGRIDDPVWQLAPATTGFTQKFPGQGTAPSEPTTVRVLYDDDNLYIAFDCVQRLSQRIDRMARRDREVDADVVSVSIDTRRDHTTAFRFEVSSAGVLVDGIHFNDTEFSADWDENWEAFIATTAAGWSAEFRIPLRILRFAALPVQDWGFQARRYISAARETDEWSYIPRTVAGEVSRYGRLEDLVELKPGRSVEVRPFVLGRVRHRDPVPGGAISSGSDLSGSGGLDVKWHITQNLTLDGAINPDFAQVEADEVILNLTNFETFYPEKRPFFLEGIDIFSTPLQLLYTRRIGGVPGLPALRAGEQFTDTPEPAPIYGAVKLGGRVANVWTLGLLAAVTGRDDLPVRLADGTPGSRLAVPLTAFEVLRLRREVGFGSHIGFVATATTRVEPSLSYPILPSGGALCADGSQLPPGSRCFHDAYATGIDGRWRSPGGDYLARAQVVGTLIENGPARTFADGTVIRSGDLGNGGLVSLAKEGGAHVVGDLQYDWAARKLDFNDLGFMQRQNLHHVQADLEYRTLDPWWKTVETHSRFEFYDRENFDGLGLGRAYQLNTNWTLANYWSTFLEVHYRPAYFDDRELGNGTALEREGLIGVQYELHSDPRRRVQSDLVTTTQFLSDGFHFDGYDILTARVLPQFDLELIPAASYTAGEPRYTSITNAPGQYLFGKLRASSVGVTLRATYTFTPRLTLQGYAQLFLAAGHYSDFSSFTAPPGVAHPEITLAQLMPAPTPGTNPDFQVGALNVNLVLRWEYRLGSTLFLVYTRSQSPPRINLMPGQSAELDLSSIPRGPAADVILLKLSYWIG
jgi:hypothetical protein